MIGLAVEFKEDTSSFGPNGSPSGSVVEHRHFAKHLSLLQQLYQSLFSRRALNDLQLTAIYHKHVTFVRTLTYNNCSTFTRNLGHSSDKSIDIVIVEVFKEKKWLQPEENAAINSRFSLDYRYFEILPKVMASEDFSTDTSSLFIPFISLLSLFEPSCTVVLFVWVAVGQVGKHLKIFCFFLKPTPAEIQLNRAPITMFFGLFLMTWVSSS